MAPRLPSLLLDRSHPHYQAAVYGDSMITLTRWLRRLAIPIGIGAGFGMHAALSLLTGMSEVFGMLFGFFVCMWLATRVCRVPWTHDFRPPVLVLRSRTDERTKHGDYLPADDFTGRGGKNSYVWQLTHALWDWARVVLFLQEMVPGDLDTHAVIVEVDDADWENHVLDLAERAWLVLVFPASTPSCVHELELLRAHDLLEKTVLFMRPRPSAGAKLLATLLGYGGLRQADHRGDWDTLRAELASHDVHLPEYQEQGMVFTPTTNYGVRKHINLEHNDAPWRRLPELVPGPGVSPQPLWNIVGYGNAFEAVDKSRTRGGTAAGDGLTPGHMVIHDEERMRWLPAVRVVRRPQTVHHGD